MSNRKKISEEAPTPAAKAALADNSLANRDTPDTEIEQLWMNEAERRIDAYQRGAMKALTIEEVLQKYK